MSDMQTLSELKSQCETRDNCTEYQSYLQTEQSQVDTYAIASNQSAITWGIIIALVGLLVLLTPFIKPLRRFQRFSLPKLAVAAPIIIGLIAGVFVGFAVSFSACYKEECSLIESSAMLTIPAASLIVTIPIAKKFSKKREAIADSISHTKPIGWIVVGVLIIIFAVFRTASTMSENNLYNDSRKDHLQTLER
jgi:uncharacterized integral membrane protein